MLPLGWVIQNVEGKLFAGYLHPGTRKTGYTVWVAALDNSNFDGGRAAIFRSSLEGSEIAQAIRFRDNIPCEVLPVGILRNS